MGKNQTTLDANLWLQSAPSVLGQRMSARFVRPERRKRDTVEGEHNGLRTRHVARLLAMTT